jgi:ABC-type oligopeptide transport system substrate-binding subunit
MALSLDMDFESFTQGMGKDSSQFLASGVFGYNPAIKDSTDLQAIEYQNYQPQILLPKNFEKIAESLTIALEKHSIYPQFSFENLYELEPKQVSRNYDLIFFGFKSDFFDGQSLFESFQPDSKFNYGNYNSQEFNQLVEQLTETTKIKPRQKLLKDLSQKILDPQKPLGVPLFENQVYYALSKNYQLNPRLDGYLDLSLISY